MNLDVTKEALPNTNAEIPEKLTPDMVRQLMRQYAQHQRILGMKKRKLTLKNPDLVIREKKAKRKLSNKNRKINQAKARYGK